MKVVDIHPEELIDKLQAGELNSAERERLDAHVEQCSACRFEIGVRADLAQDAPLFAERPQLTFARQQAAPRAPTLANGAACASGSVRPRVPRRWPLVMLAAALVLCAGGATAAVVTGAVAPRIWLHWSPERKAVSAARPAGELKIVQAPKRPAKSVISAAAPLPAVPAAPDSEVTAAAAPSAEATLPASETAPRAPAQVAMPVREAVHAAPAVAAPSPASVAFPSLGSEAAQSHNALPSDAAPQRSPAASLFSDANRARRDGNMDRAVALYQSLQARFPSSAESELSRALVAQMLLERGSPEAALAGFDRYLAQGTPVLGAEALVGRARALEQLGKLAQAAAAWQEVQARFPGSVHARLAAARLVALGTR
jgi:TolA-binding protein